METKPLFSTLDWSKNGDGQVLKSTNDPTSYNQKSHVACDGCKIKKRKCDGVRSGCNHCIKEGKICEYTSKKAKGGSLRGKSAESAGQEKENTFGEGSSNNTSTCDGGGSSSATNTSVPAATSVSQTTEDFAPTTLGAGSASYGNDARIRMPRSANTNVAVPSTYPHDPFSNCLPPE